MSEFDMRAFGCILMLLFAFGCEDRGAATCSKSIANSRSWFYSGEIRHSRIGVGDALLSFDCKDFNVECGYVWFSRGGVFPAKMEGFSFQICPSVEGLVMSSPKGYVDYMFYVHRYPSGYDESCDLLARNLYLAERVVSFCSNFSEVGDSY